MFARTLFPTGSAGGVRYIHLTLALAERSKNTHEHTNTNAEQMCLRVAPYECAG